MKSSGVARIGVAVLEADPNGGSLRPDDRAKVPCTELQGGGVLQVLRSTSTLPP